MKQIFKFTAISFAALFMVACQNTDEKKEVATIISQMDESEIEKVREFGREAISDLQKMFYQVGEIPFDSYKEGLSHYGLNETQQDAFISFLENNKVEGYVRNILFNDYSEKIKLQNGFYTYQITTEAYIKNGNEEKKHYVTYELTTESSILQGYTIKNLSYEIGHSIEGVDYTITNNSLDDSIQQKLDELVTNSWNTNSKNKEYTTLLIQTLFLEDALANKISSTIQSNKKEVKQLLQSNLTLTEKNISEDGYRAFGTGQYTINFLDKNDQVQQLRYDISITLQQQNPVGKKYNYLIDELSMKKK